MEGQRVFVVRLPANPWRLLGLLPLLAVLDATSAAAEVTYPVASAAIEITDPAMTPYQWSTPNHEIDVATRIGQSLYFIFRSGDARAYIRRFDIRRGVFDNADFASHVTPHDLAQVFFDGEPRDGKAPGQYHAEPSLLRDGGGRLHAFFPIHGGGDTGRAGWQNAVPSGGKPIPGFPPLHRAIDPADLHDSLAWPKAGGLAVQPGAHPCLELLDPACGSDGFFSSTFHDLSGVYDDLAKFTHVVGEMGVVYLELGDPPVNARLTGLSRGYYRIDSAGHLDGPHVIVKAATVSAPDCNGTESDKRGNIFTKGDLRLGSETSGPRSLHLVWGIRHTFVYGPGLGSRTIEHNYDLYYARSTDGGHTWTNIKGEFPHTWSNPINADFTDPASDLAGFRVVSGDIHQDSSRSFALDLEGNPVLVYRKRRGKTGVDVCGHADIGADGIVWDLYMVRWDPGSGQWTTPELIDDRRNWTDPVRSRIDREGKLWLFYGAGSGSIPKYRFLGADGARWTPTAGFGDLGRGLPTGWRLHSYADPVNENYHYLAYRTKNVTGEDPGRFYFLRLQLTPDPDADLDGVADLEDNCPAAPNPAQYDGDGDGIGDLCDGD
jgi:hypothetical protein